MSSSTSSRPRQHLTAIGARQLVEQLPQREQALLGELARLKLVATHQLARLVCPEHEFDSAMRLVRRHLARLVRSGLVRRFANRARDRKAGAPGYLYALTAKGLRATGAATGIGTRQRKAYRPSDAFVDHRLAISELRTRLAEHERAGGVRVREFLAEPDCWRDATGPAGERLIVKPDSLVRLAIGEVEVSWFVEIDRGTESSSVIRAKCETYRKYELTNIEQHAHEVFPGVIFAVSSPARARQIERVIARQPAADRELFVVATEDEAIRVMTRIEGDDA